RTDGAGPGAVRVRATAVDQRLAHQPADQPPDDEFACGNNTDRSPADQPPGGGATVRISA
ncbi:MAG: hypothetical protein ACRD0E_06885, partial [Acidimicrobiales bacterium]